MIYSELLLFIIMHIHYLSLVLLAQFQLARADIINCELKLIEMSELRAVVVVVAFKKRTDI